MRTIFWEDSALKMIDQRRLPAALEFVTLHTPEEVAQAIRDMVVRGAPAIGVAAAFGMVLASQQSTARTPRDLFADLQAAAHLLKSARPTAVNLAWAVDKMLASVTTSAENSSVHPLSSVDNPIRSSVTTSAENSSVHPLSSAAASIRSSVTTSAENSSVHPLSSAAAFIRSSVTTSAENSSVHPLSSVDNPIRSSVKQSVDNLLLLAQRLADEDVETNQRMAAHGASLLADGDTVIHHCNTGALATVDWGTALGVIRMAHEQGKHIHVLVDETRPRLQGARLTAWELEQYGIPYEIISDNMAGYFLHAGKVQKVLFGADRITANGDVANKIGTYMLALAAHDNNVPVYCVAPTSTIDFSLAHGGQIPIEERNPAEVLGIQFQGEQVAPAGAQARNPAFDVTPNRLISAIVTENGIAYPPFDINLKKG